MTRGVWGAGALLLLAGLMVPAVPTAALTTHNGATTFDNFEDWTLNDVAGGAEIAYATYTPVQYTVGPFDTSTYGVQPGETAETNNLNGCIGSSGPVFAGRTAWFRFNPGVNGSINVLATTPGYDSVLMVREAADRTWSTTQLQDLHGLPSTCADQVTGPGSETVGAFAARADRVYYIQVGGKCPAGSPAVTCDDPEVPGGATTVRVIFTPSDSDLDQDGIADKDDNCPSLPGVSAPSPFHGCPAGPTPPGGTPRITIVSQTGDALNTGSAQVLLKLDWRQGTRKVLVDNGIGDTPQQVDFTQPSVPWTLPATSKSETRQVNVQFLGPGIDDSRSDTITLDTQAPTVPRTLVIPPQLGDWYIGAITADDKSGVRSFTVLDKHRKTIGKPATCKKKCLRFDGYVTSATRRPAFVRVIDNAGNFSKLIRLHVPRSACKYTLSALSPSTGSRCFRLGATCTSKDVASYNFALARLGCRRGVVVKARSI
jgi:hypothetical protein